MGPATNELREMTETGRTTPVIDGHSIQTRSRTERRFGARGRAIDSLLVFGPSHRLLGDCVADALDAAGVEVELVEPSASGVVQMPVPEPATVLIDSAVLDDCGGTALVDGVHEFGGKVLVVATDPAPGPVSPCGETGADGIVAATAELRTLVAVVRRALETADVERDRHGDSSVACDRAGSTSDHDLLASLSPREQAVLDSMMRGLSAVEIAHEHFVALSTVRSQIHSILIHLNVRSQLAAVARAHEAGWHAVVARNHQI